MPVVTIPRSAISELTVWSAGTPLSMKSRSLRSQLLFGLSQQGFDVRWMLNWGELDSIPTLSEDESRLLVWATSLRVQGGLLPIGALYRAWTPGLHWPGQVRRMHDNKSDVDRVRWRDHVEVHNVPREDVDTWNWKVWSDPACSGSESGAEGRAKVDAVLLDVPILPGAGAALFDESVVRVFLPQNVGPGGRP